MVRTEGWELRFSGFLKERKCVPFGWGVNDCVLFCADAVHVITGEDLASDWRGYKTQQEADELIQDDIVFMVSNVLGNYHTNLLMAKRGDVVFTDLGALGMVDDTGQKIAMVTEKGLRRVNMKHATHIWSY